MKRIENRKVEYPGGYVSYFMNRLTPEGFFYRHVLHLSPEQILRGRGYVASQLRRARGDLRESVAALTGVGPAGRRSWARGK